MNIFAVNADKVYIISDLCKSVNYLSIRQDKKIVKLSKLDDSLAWLAVVFT
jgi:hypothetical protein